MIVFSNPGVMDIRGLTTFGVNAKDSTKNPIGRFGTGLKYALATLMRTGHEVTIIVDDTTYTFTTRIESVREKDFEFIHLMYRRRPRANETGHDDPSSSDISDGYDLAFTTALGRDWKGWQAYRELYCNCVTDEGGTVVKISDDTPLVLEPVNTTVIVKGSELEYCHDTREQFILDPARKPLFVVPGVVEVYTGTSMTAFYRGIRVGDIEPARYTYNVLSWMYLTEDRTMLIPSQFTDAVKTAATSGLNLEFTKDVINIVAENGQERKGLEAALNFEGTTLLGSVFNAAKDMVERAKASVNNSFYGAFRSYENEHLLNRIVDAGEAESEVFTAALADCKRIGFEWTGAVRTVADLGAGVNVKGKDRLIMVAISALTCERGTWAYESFRGELLREIALLEHNCNSETKLTDLLLGRLFAQALPEAATGPLRCSDENCPGVEACRLSVCKDSRPVEAPPESVYLMTGTWSRSGKISHREIVDQSRVENLRALHYIEFTDGTTLNLDVYYLPKANTVGLTTQLSYDELIREAVRKKPGQSYVRVIDLQDYPRGHQQPPKEAPEENLASAPPETPMTLDDAVGLTLAADDNTPF